MTNRPGLRRSMKYVGLSASAVVFLAWAVSIKCVYGTSVGGSTVVFADGVLILLVGTNAAYDELLPALHVFNSGDYGFRMPSTASAWGLLAFGLPLWIPFLIIGVIPTLLSSWLKWRAVQPCRCRVCGYNLTGKESGVCPECATPVPRQKTAGFAHSIAKSPRPFPRRSKRTAKLVLMLLLPPIAVGVLLLTVPNDSDSVSRALELPNKFDEDGFQRLQIGMSKSEVVELLGPPRIKGARLGKAQSDSIKDKIAARFIKSFVLDARHERWFYGDFNPENPYLLIATPDDAFVIYFNKAGEVIETRTPKGRNSGGRKGVGSL